MPDKPIAAGKSSFELVNIKRLFSELRLTEDSVFLDVACGRGAYAIAASAYIGQTGRIYAIDLWEEGIDALQREIKARHINNISAQVADVGKRMPIADLSIDVCLMATVLHDLIRDNTDDGTLKEIKRVLKPQGKLAVIEFKKTKGTLGPPIGIRISPEEVITRLLPYSLRIAKTMDIGPHNYLSMFIKEGE
jgi:ubiquinone/menaquinone biosynthesis C-methylase UbiE